VVGFLLMLSCNWIFHSVRGDNQFGLRQFTGIFLRGNPFLAMGSLIRYQFAHDEEDAVRATEQLGQAKSRLTVDELLEALNDPRFNVRFEAVVTIARMPPDPRLVKALIEILNGTELAMETVAAWALGRMGDSTAIPTLRDKLDSPYLSVRAHSARALGKLKDQSVVPLLLERLNQENDKGLQMAYVSALGNLRATKAAGRTLEILYAATNQGARMELSLALARLMGDEHHFIQLLRAARSDPGTTAARTLTSFRRKLERSVHPENEALPLLTAAIDAFARNDLAGGIHPLAEAATRLSDTVREPGPLLLEECARRLAEVGPGRTEYLLLTLHTLAVG
jgi:hypothetical protein